MSKSDLSLAWSLIRRNVGTIALAGGILAALGFSYVTPRAEMNAIRAKQAEQDTALGELRRDVRALVKVSCFRLTPQEIALLDLACPASSVQPLTLRPAP
jgi:hypothetical protein